jgi:hypothetical protein
MSAPISDERMIGLFVASNRMLDILPDNGPEASTVLALTIAKVTTLLDEDDARRAMQIIVNKALEMRAVLVAANDPEPELEPAPAEAEDGQPDEQQEWRDYDADC